jgi:hypothetical protein
MMLQFNFPRCLLLLTFSRVGAPIVVNNRAEGNAPLIVQGLLGMLRGKVRIGN